MNQEESEQNEVDGMKRGADFTRKVMHMKMRKRRIRQRNRY